MTFTVLSIDCLSSYYYLPSLVHYLCSWLPPTPLLSSMLPIPQCPSLPSFCWPISAFYDDRIGTGQWFHHSSRAHRAHLSYAITNTPYISVCGWFSCLLLPWWVVWSFSCKCIWFYWITIYSLSPASPYSTPSSHSCFHCSRCSHYFFDFVSMMPPIQSHTICTYQSTNHSFYVEWGTRIVYASILCSSVSYSLSSAICRTPPYPSLLTITHISTTYLSTSHFSISTPLYCPTLHTLCTPLSYSPWIRQSSISTSSLLSLSPSITVMESSTDSLNLYKRPSLPPLSLFPFPLANKEF